MLLYLFLVYRLLWMKQMWLLIWFCGNRLGSVETWGNRFGSSLNSWAEPPTNKIMALCEVGVEQGLGRARAAHKLSDWCGALPALALMGGRARILREVVVGVQKSASLSAVVVALSWVPFTPRVGFVHCWRI